MDCSPSNSIRFSFSQFGEDRLIETLMSILFGKDYPFTYLEVGTNHPCQRNNTYLAYINGSKGVVVEPNKLFSEVIPLLRPSDVFCNCGVSFDGSSQATYYDFGSSSGVNTFNPALASIREQDKTLQLKQKVVIPLVDINELVRKHFADKTLDLLSIDCEGYDFDVLKSFDFSTCRPKMICIEVDKTNTHRIYGNHTINEFMTSRDYAFAATTVINNIYVDLSQVIHGSWLPLCYDDGNTYFVGNGLIGSGSIVIRGESLDKALTGGRGRLEPWGIWSDHTYEPTLFLDLSKTTAILCKGYEASHHQALRLDVEMRSIALQNVEISYGDVKTVITVRPNFETYHFYFTWNLQNYLLSFRPLSPVSPQEKGMSTDTRKLGIGIKAITVSRL